MKIKKEKNLNKKERKILSEEASEVFVFAHIANAEDENAKTDQRDHDQHGSSERVKDPANPKFLGAEGEPDEIMNSAESRRVQRRHKRKDRQGQGSCLADNREPRGGDPARTG